jgi:hypothetical protein
LPTGHTDPRASPNVHDPLESQTARVICEGIDPHGFRTIGGTTMRFITAEEVVLTARPTGLRWYGIANRFVLSTCLLVLLGFLALMTWRELVSEFDASIQDFALSLETHDRGESR